MCVWRGHFNLPFVHENLPSLTLSTITSVNASRRAVLTPTSYAQDIQEKGYRGGETSVRSFVARLRKRLPGMARPPKRAKNGDAGSTSPRELRWLLSKREEELTRSA